METLAEENKSQLETLQRAKAAAESEITTLKEKLDRMENEDTASATQLEAVRGEV
jgi:hypothetical protein